MIGNFFSNVSAPVRLLNNILQGEFIDASIVVGRFVINSTVGVLGIGDPAADAFGLKKQSGDFGQTLGKWGVGEGVYMCWPILGPSNLRDTVGHSGDAVSHPIFYIHTEPLQTITYSVTERVNALSTGASVYEDLKKISIDPYVATRKAYTDFRRELVEERDGEK